MTHRAQFKRNSTLAPQRLTLLPPGSFDDRVTPLPFLQGDTRWHQKTEQASLAYEVSFLIKASGLRAFKIFVLWFFLKKKYATGPNKIHDPKV